MKKLVVGSIFVLALILSPLESANAALFPFNDIHFPGLQGPQGPPGVNGNGSATGENVGTYGEGIYNSTAANDTLQFFKLVGVDPIVVGKNSTNVILSFGANLTDSACNTNEFFKSYNTVTGFNCGTASGSLSAIKSINTDTTENQTLSGVSGNTTVTDNGGGSHTINTGPDIVTDTGLPQTINKNITIGSGSKLTLTPTSTSPALNLGLGITGIPSSAVPGDVWYYNPGTYGSLYFRNNINSYPILDSNNAVLVVNKEMGDNTLYVDSADTTKQLQLWLGGATASTKTTLYANQTADRQISFPDKSGTIALISDIPSVVILSINNDTTPAQSITGGQGISVADPGSGSHVVSTNFKVDDKSCATGYFISAFTNSTGGYTCTLVTLDAITHINGNNNTNQTIQGVSNHISVSSSGGTTTIDVAFKVNNISCSAGTAVTTFDNATGTYTCATFLNSLSAGQGINITGSGSSRTVATTFLADDVSCNAGYFLTSYVNSTGVYTCTQDSDSTYTGANIGHGGSGVFSGIVTNQFQFKNVTSLRTDLVTVSANSTDLNLSSPFKSDNISCSAGFAVTAFSNSTGVYTCSTFVTAAITQVNGDATAHQVLAGTANHITISDVGATHTFDIAFKIDNYTCTSNKAATSYDNVTGATTCTTFLTAATGVTSVNSIVGAVTIAGTSGNITINNAGSTVTANTGVNIPQLASAETFSGNPVTINHLKLGGAVNGNSQNVTSVNQMNATGFYQGTKQVLDTITGTSPITAVKSGSGVTVACATCSTTTNANITGAGSANQVPYFTTSTNIAGSSKMIWDQANGILKGGSDTGTSIGTSTNRLNTLYGVTINDTNLKTNTIAASTGSGTTVSSGTKLTTTPTTTTNGLNIGSGSTYPTSPRQGDIAIVSNGVKYNDNNNVTQTLTPTGTVVNSINSYSGAVSIVRGTSNNISVTNSTGTTTSTLNNQALHATGWRTVLWLERFTSLPVGATISLGSLNVQTAAGNVRVSIYQDDGSSNNPSTLLGQSSSTAVGGTGVQDYTVNAVVPASGSVWMGFETDSNSLDLKYSVASVNEFSHTYGSAPSPMGTTSPVSDSAPWMKVTYTLSSISIDVGSNVVVTGSTAQTKSGVMTLSKMSDASTIVGNADNAKVIAFDNSAMTTAKTTTLTNLAAHTEVLNIPDTIQTEAFAIKPNINFSSPANPANTASTTGVMSNTFMTFIPKVTGRIQISVCGTMSSGTATDGAKFDVRYGTSAITEGNAIGNTLVGSAKTMVSTAANNAYSACNVVQVTGLAINTKIFIQIGKFAVTGGTASFSNFDVSVFEL